MANHRGSRQDVQLYVKELTIVESGTYSDQFLRPYEAETSGGLLDSIEERLAKTNRFTPSILANIAHQFMIPSMDTRGLIDIPHGWNERRGRFILELDVVTSSGGRDRLKQIVMGYTNTMGFTTRNVDHDMEFYVNNTYLLQRQDVRNRDGRYEEVWTPKATDDVLSDRDNAGIRRRDDELYTMRPEDVYAAMDAESSGAHILDVTDLRTTLSKNAVKSRTSNRLASRYMSKVLETRQRALDNDQFGNPGIEINSTAHGYALDHFANDDLFLRQIANNRDLSNAVDNFTFRDLLNIDPDAETRLNLMMFDENARAMSRYDQESDRLDGQEEYHRIAALVATAVPALMMECNIHTISFQTHNQGRIGEQYETAVTRAASLVKGTVMDQFIDAFLFRLEEELLIPITRDGMFDIGLNIDCRVFGEIDFTMFWDGSNRGRFIYPTFCSSLNSPIVTNSRSDVQRMAKSFTSLFDEFLPATSLGASSNGRGNW